MLAKQCPQCHQPISLALLKSSGTHKAFIKRKAFACPNCETLIQLPQKAEKLVSIGILCSLIFAPLSFYFIAAPTLSYLLLSNGAILILIGSFTNKLTLAQDSSNTNMETASTKKDLNKESKDQPTKPAKEVQKEADNNE
jgi:ssDNA-binding Zn-finger/Zn-ribbon topoisomerase 1